MKAKHKDLINQALATLSVDEDVLSSRDIAESISQLQEVLDDLLYFYQDGDQTVACIENCIYYLEEMQDLDSDDEDYQINLGVVVYELNKLL